jgi:hypothetical protein
MTPKEKAIYLYLMFKQRTYYVEVFHTIQLLDKFHNNAKDCALIAVNQLLDAIDWDYYEGSLHPELTYWREVKQEIEAL